SRVLRLIVLAVLIGGGAAICTGADPARRAAREAEALAGGKVEAGRVALTNYGCNTCHTIPGIADARGLVGPPLTQLANRIYIAGVLANTPDNLVLWIQQPRSVNPRTAMPNLGVDEVSARNIAAYLYALR